uniref:Uncharacterized protein n=1 Tax=Acidianus sulfidivorans JP7 TaxID=619593 RepID=A0A2U9IPY9_9CREN
METKVNVLQFLNDGFIDLNLVKRCRKEQIGDKEEIYRYIFYLGSTSEKISKGILMLYPAILLKLLDTKKVKLEILCELKDIIEISFSTEKIKQKLKHEPITKSGIKEIIDTLNELTKSEELKKKVYEAISKYLQKDPKKKKI